MMQRQFGRAPHNTGDSGGMAMLRMNPSAPVAPPARIPQHCRMPFASAYDSGGVKEQPQAAISNIYNRPPGKRQYAGLAASNNARPWASTEGG